VTEPVARSPAGMCCRLSRQWFAPRVGTETRRELTERLLRAAAEAGPEERAALLGQAIEANLQVAREVARRYHGKGIPADDLHQVAYLGLVKAAHAFDPERSHDFLSYAVPTIRGEVRRHFRDAGWVVRPPRRIQELQPRVVTADSELHHELGRTPQAREIAERLGVEAAAVVETLAVQGCFAPVSLDTSDADPDDDNRSLLNRFGRDEVGFARAEARLGLVEQLAKLSARERFVLRMWIVEDRTQVEIGRLIGVTQMQVSRLISGALDRLRREMTAA
jgi:RNA polymerase sigma-B factor